MMKAYLVFVFMSYAAAENCPKNIEEMPNIDINKLTGTWYRNQYIDNVLGGKCVTLTFSVNKNDTVSVIRKAISYDTGKPVIVEGWAEIENAKLALDFPSSNVTIECAWILKIDYDSFFVLWGWKNDKIKAWLFTREQHPDEKHLNQALSAFDNTRLNSVLLQENDQVDCPEDSKGKVSDEV